MERGRLSAHRIRRSPQRRSIGAKLRGIRSSRAAAQQCKGIFQRVHGRCQRVAGFLHFRTGILQPGKRCILIVQRIIQCVQQFPQCGHTVRYTAVARRSSLQLFLLLRYRSSDGIATYQR